MVIFGYGKEAIRELNAEIKQIKADIDILNDRIKSLKGYVYAKKVHLDTQEDQGILETTKDLNNHFSPF